MSQQYKKHIVITLAFLATMAALLVPSFLIRSDHSWQSTLLASCALGVVFVGLAKRVDKSFALVIFMPPLVGLLCGL